MFRQMCRKSDERGGARLLSNESIALDVYNFNNDEKFIDENKEEKFQLPPLPKISRDVWIAILDYCTTTEAVKLGVSLGKGGNSLLRSYVNADNDLLLNGYFPLSTPNAFSLKDKVRQGIGAEKEKLKQKEERMSSIIMKAISCFVLLGYGGGAGVYLQGHFVTKSADSLYPDVKLFYNDIEQTEEVFSHNASSCTIIQDQPCDENRSSYDCSLYHSYMFKCEEPPYDVVPCTTPLFVRLYYGSPLFKNYTDICEEIRRIQSLATPYHLRAFFIVMATTALAYCAVSTEPCKKEISNEIILKRKFSSLWNSLTEKEKSSYKQLINLISVEGLKISDILQRIEAFIETPSSEYQSGEYQRCLFFKRHHQLKKINEVKIEVVQNSDYLSLAN
jgi:hypothetical protein